MTGGQAWYLHTRERTAKLNNGSFTIALVQQPGGSPAVALEFHAPSQFAGWIPATGEQARQAGGAEVLGEDAAAALASRRG